MGAGGEMWFSGPTSTDEWLACIPPQSASSPHWRASASLSWGSPSEIWPEATCGPVFLWNSLRRCVSIAWSYDQHFNRSPPHQEWASWCPLAASHPSIQSSSHRLDLSVLEYSFPRFLTSWSLLCWSQYSLFWGKKKSCVEREINSWWVLTTESALVHFQLIPTASEAQGDKVTRLAWIVFHGNDRNLT